MTLLIAVGLDYKTGEGLDRWIVTHADLLYKYLKW